jgi:hypothetical protein
MKKYKLQIVIVLALLSSGLHSVYAKDVTSRKGFVIGFDLGGGAAHFGGGGNSGAFMFGMKIGGGLSEHVLLLAEFFDAQSARNDSASLTGVLFSSQFFLPLDFYVRPGVGFGYGKVKLPGGASVSSDNGFAAGFAFGHEWRPTRRFSLSPEIKADYLRFEGLNNFAYGAVLDLRWYF